MKVGVIFNHKVSSGGPIVMLWNLTRGGQIMLDAATSTPTREWAVDS